MKEFPSRLHPEINAAQFLADILDLLCCGCLGHHQLRCSLAAGSFSRAV